MNDILINQKIEEYIINHSDDEPELLYSLYRETYQKHVNPRMLSGHYQGRILSMISKIIRPEKILEIGTFTGYSSLCLAEGLKETGRLYTIDIDEELKDIISKYFKLSKYSNQLTNIVGDAIEEIPKIKEKFDLVFIDADKENYCNYFNMVFPKLNKNGIILTDNVLWSGKVIEELNDKDSDTKAIIEYNKMIKENPLVEVVVLPIRDGLSLVRKI
ncbi:O-methyltransferase [Ichthyobacterium seriolicida]|uniref:O-methyltransferase n=1 Tax=Ichthyobacterium seriolicida TaxID=242600 RepID=A0A1J1E274_9FLAO|nr:class I SAM-dependent methyltransferase [Ichthyobacterium seriolicida]BAV94140.1 O-methyltransferase [Ichthyobacterium seriolicida]